MVDAYQDITIPFQMSSVEFFRLVHDHLAGNGVMVVNLNMRGGGEDSINAHLCDTIASVFPQVYVIDVPTSSNTVLFASDNPELIERFHKNASLEQDKDITELMKRIDKDLTRYRGGNRIMTDDKAPVELLGMKVIDELIFEEVSYYKDVYKEEGLKGLIDALSN
jgi:hypothetical protein